MDARESAGAGVDGVTDADAVGDAVFAADVAMHAEIADGAFVIVTAEVCAGRVGNSPRSEE